MAYFLKKSYFKKGLYLQIYESFYDPVRKDTAHRSHKALGYVDALISSGIEEPVSYYKDFVAEMNAETKTDKQKELERQITETSPEKHLGYFLIKAIFDSLKVSKFFDFLQLQREFRFRIADVIESLVYSRIVEPYSRRHCIGRI